MNKMIEYVFAGGPQHGQVFQCLAYDTAAPSASAANDGLPAFGPSYCHAGSDTLRIAATRTMSSGATTRYIVLDAQATGEQFLTILAA